MPDLPDPWESLKRPATVETLVARRVGEELRWPFFWALDAGGQPLLMLQHDPDIGTEGRLPRSRGMAVERRKPVGEPALVTLRLIRSEFRDVFREFCAEVIRATAGVESEREAVGKFITRAWKWQRFLAAGAGGRLSAEEQKGLLGELRVLTDVVAPALGMAGAVEAWVGPFGAAKDFEIGRSCVESKAFSGGGVASVRITSEHQLSTEALDALFLVVSQVAPSVAGGAVTLPEYVACVRARIDADAPEARQAFDSRLAASGFDEADDYSDSQWHMGAIRCFRVGKGFPCITPAQFPSGVHRVHYRIGLEECKPFRISHDDLEVAIRGQHDDHT